MRLLPASSSGRRRASAFLGQNRVRVKRRPPSDGEWCKWPERLSCPSAPASQSFQGGSGDPAGMRALVQGNEGVRRETADAVKPAIMPEGPPAPRLARVQPHPSHLSRFPRIGETSVRCRPSAIHASDIGRPLRASASGREPAKSGPTAVLLRLKEASASTSTSPPAGPPGRVITDGRSAAPNFRPGRSAERLRGPPSLAVGGPPRSRFAVSPVGPTRSPSPSPDPAAPKPSARGWGRPACPKRREIPRMLFSVVCSKELRPAGQVAAQYTQAENRARA